MESIPSLGRWLLIGALILAILGALVLLLERAGLSPGRLPGDLRLERPGLRCLLPLGTSLLLSLILTLVLNLILRILNR